MLRIVPLLLEWLEEIEFFCVCVAETVLLLLLINITVYIAVVVACQNGQLNGPVNVNMIFQTVCNILSFLSCFATQSYAQTYMQIKTSFCSKFLPKTAYLVLR